MKVKDLKAMLKGVDDDMDVYIPTSDRFDGFFKSPCSEASGALELGIEEDSDETRPAFCLVPCGFFDEISHEEHIKELN